MNNAKTPNPSTSPTGLSLFRAAGHIAPLQAYRVQRIYREFRKEFISLRDNRTTVSTGTVLEFSRFAPYLTGQDCLNEYWKRKYGSFKIWFSYCTLPAQSASRTGSWMRRKSSPNIRRPGPGYFFPAAWTAGNALLRLRMPFAVYRIRLNEVTIARAVNVKQDSVRALFPWIKRG